jgi:chromosomal replication initiation ATPase DnaA
MKAMLRNLYNKQDVFLTGSSGTGKTQLHAALIAILLAEGKDRSVQSGARSGSFGDKLSSKQTYYLYDAPPVTNDP